MPPPPRRTRAGRRAPPRRPARCSAPASSGAPGAGGLPAGSSRCPPAPRSPRLYLGVGVEAPLLPRLVERAAVAAGDAASDGRGVDEGGHQGAEDDPGVDDAAGLHLYGSHRVGRRHSVPPCGWHWDACPARRASKATKPREKLLRAVPPLVTLFLRHPSAARPGLVDALTFEGSAALCSVGGELGTSGGWDRPSVQARGGPTSCWGRQRRQKQCKALTSRMFSLLSLSTRREPETRSCSEKR